MAENTSWFNRGLRPGSSMIAEGASGSPADPAQMVHEMKTAARKAAEGPKPPEVKSPTVKEGTYEGAGGYKYEVMPGGEIKIIEAPGGRGVGVTLKSGHPAHTAISDELETATPIGPEFSRQGEMDTLIAMGRSQENRDAQVADLSGGVVAGEGKSGKLAKKEDLNPAPEKAIAKK